MPIRMKEIVISGFEKFFKRAHRVLKNIFKFQQNRSNHFGQFSI